MAEDPKQPVNDPFHQYVIQMETLMAAMGLTLHDAPGGRPQYIPQSRSSQTEDGTLANLQRRMASMIERGLLNSVENAGSGPARFRPSQSQQFASMAQSLSRALQRNS